MCDDAIDTTTASAELVFNLFSSLAQFERRLIQERINVGPSTARARGKVGAQIKIKSSNLKVVMAKTMHEDKRLSIDNICKSLNISRATFYRYLQK